MIPIFIASVNNYKHGGMLLYWGLGAGSEGVGQTALAAVLTILVEGHEDTGTTLSSGTFTAKALNFSVRFDLIILQDCHLDLLPLVLDLLGGLWCRSRQKLRCGIGQEISSHCRSSSFSS